MKVTAINENDWECLKKIRLESLNDSPEAFGISYDEIKNLSPQEWQTLASGLSGPRFLIAYRDDKAVGVIAGIEINGEYELISMWVNPSERRQNVGIDLVKALLSSAFCEGYSRVVLNVSADNISAYRLYEKSGFVAVGEVRTLNSHNDIQLQKMVCIL